MSKYLLLALDWSEVWALLIPLAVLLFRRRQPAILKPVIAYLWLALLLNCIIDAIMVYRHTLPVWLQSNNPWYNIHALVRFACFSIFFIKLPQPSFTPLKKALVGVSVIFIIINFGFFENFLNPDTLSGNLLAAEAYLLLIYCMQYYLAELRNDDKPMVSGADFWIVTGLSLYVVTNFFVFLFYLPLLTVNPGLSVNMWNVHNIAFIIFCLFITKALYGSVRYQHTV